MALNIDELERAIQSGEHVSVKHTIRKIAKRGSLSRNQKTELANLCKRVGIPEVGLTLLRQYVRNRFNDLEMATSPEIIEYAGCLVSLGAIHEAINLLHSRNFQYHPEAFFTLGMAYTALWDGKNAAKYFLEFIQSNGVSDYRKQIARINLAQSYLSFENSQTILPLVDSILKENESVNSSLIAGNALIFKAQTIIDEDPLESLKLLEEARKYSEKMSTLNLWIDKWHAYALFYTGHKEKAIRDMKLCYKNSSKFKNTETMRDSYFYYSLFTQDELGIQYVYKGTPILTFREKIHKSYQATFERTFVLNQEPIGAKKGLLLNLNYPLNLKGLGNRGDSYKLLNILLSDFFRPFSIPYLFSLLKPDEYYLESSPQVMRQQLFQLKKTLKEHDLDIPISKDRYGHKIDFEKIRNVKIQLVDQEQLVQISKTNSLLLLIQKHYKNKAFRTIDIQDFTRQSMRTIQRSLKIGLDSGLLKSKRLGRQRYYYLP